MLIIQIRQGNLSSTRYFGYREVSFGLYKYIHGVEYKLLKSVIGTKAITIMKVCKDRIDVDS